MNPLRTRERVRGSDNRAIRVMWEISVETDPVVLPHDSPPDRATFPEIAAFRPHGVEVMPKERKLRNPGDVEIVKYKKHQ